LLIFFRVQRSVSESAYYRWAQNPVSKTDLRHYKLDTEIMGIFNKHKSRYGVKRIYEELKDNDWCVTENKVSERMKLMGLVAKANKPFIKTTDSNHNQYVAPNLLQQDFNAEQHNQKYVTDITYIPTDEGWLYLSVMIDLYSRMVIGWSMADNMKTKLVNDALTMAIWKRKPRKGLIWHSDRGSQYASDSHRSVLKDHGIIQSMSRKGNCWDNAVAESFFHTLKTELTNHYKFKNQKEAKNVIFEYIEVFYNRTRIHSANNYLAPVEFEKVNEKSLKSA
jgi:transposase InsO family protein